MAREKGGGGEEEEGVVWVCGRLGRSGRLDFAGSANVPQSPGRGKGTRQRPNLRAWATEGLEGGPKATQREQNKKGKREEGGKKRVNEREEDEAMAFCECVNVAQAEVKDQIRCSHPCGRPGCGGFFACTCLYKDDQERDSHAIPAREPHFHRVTAVRPQSLRRKYLQQHASALMEQYRLINSATTIESGYKAMAGVRLVRAIYDKLPWCKHRPRGGRERLGGRNIFGTSGNRGRGVKWEKRPTATVQD
ncbi:hypothetical protein C8R47DRAFT_1083726 [Mycena vitilis]|nr:hypothetical protein C8R47DRAFT_1083726 [Mycena vitilis]